ncbi:hypothetical protein JFT81_12980 [Pseudomonas sp. TH43]|uniref:hypothetical protein n=1 Tax=Pseudomonas sp. TH43 TaxID=2796407 RepID=UPI001912E9B2|nr:hypothetical protein [Pseudomonas sp. TH43]
MTVTSGWIRCVVLCGGLMAGQAFADCTPATLAGQQDLSVCKDWPAYPGLILSAEARLKHGGAQALDTYDVDVTVLQGVQPDPVATYHQAAAITLDGVSLQELTLDTARYKLTPELRAFGVRATLSNGSRLIPLEENQLSLYVREGAKLRPVLSQLVVYRYGGEWDGECTGERYETSRTLEIGKTSSHGYADLIVKTQETGTSNVVKGADCEDKITVYDPVLTTLRYDGKSYVLPKGFKGD